ncbi:group 1 glycosyl transferase [Leptolyngbya boryana NIES-2135]|jgi:colanic acid biosynthesis glycosyl transferase WcaI|uniref:Group 1 glycosyl transferase n=1 Tax=Leptolyngbya boryana NIES-2135 TaxID=1973484 RepID=A0A1Z4JC27_LEPBY|nr:MULTISPECIES: glycosyltransferase family 4 protein [Leptolyngbya]BAY54355.1 group 1 glycosyl transferase [Leptolyngbya boryana NIES-2135]MBD2370136.1 glycosyltransferase family 4 protein [Leptolyngbya sp. FACHB-161]MBD2376397.1 glycosyltransferase family 4 protein [Leptolyngbya sp. FACHB-238]MBD2400671.1 glycosyltransferase family 4 protein [Leptolyngbya sp. FACHB-239]MBD2407214.1 glycosyltransferase family 4 protein [Leptolyngbya sp. FACHB-402]
MRVLIYSYNYYPEPIGIAPLMTELAEGLVRRGHQVRVITGMPNYPQRQIYEGYRDKLYMTEKRNGVIIQRSYMWVKPKPSLIDRVLLDSSFVVTSFLQALKGWRPDVILLTVPPLPVCVPAALLSWFHNCPIVLNVQDILPEAAVHVGLLKNRTMIRVFEALEKFAYRTAHTISVIADGFVENLEGKGVSSSKLTCIPNWVDTSFIRPLSKENNAFRLENGLDGKFVVLYAGNIALTQGLETVIEAAARLKHQRDIAFAIVGEPKAIENLRQHCEAHGADNVRLLPFQPREKLPEMLAAADVGLIVQKRNVVSFNMPSKTQVLLASGRAVIASVPSTGSAAKAIKKSCGGVVVEPENPEALADQILELYNNPELTSKLGKQGRQYAIERYSFEQALNQYEALFEKVVRTPAVKPAYMFSVNKSSS